MIAIRNPIVLSFRSANRTFLEGFWALAVKPQKMSFVSEASLDFSHFDNDRNNSPINSRYFRMSGMSLSPAASISLYLLKTRSLTVAYSSKLFFIPLFLRKL